MLVTVVLTMTFGWATVALDVSASGVGALAAGIATVLFFEAIPEETIFRGYIYSTFSFVTRRWVAAAATVGLFVLLPAVIFPLQKYVLGLNTTLGGSNSLDVSYLIMMVIFGSFVQFLRIASGSIWTGIGFHAAFVLMNRIMSPRPTSFIKFNDVVGSQAIQLTLLANLLIVAVAAIVYPRVMNMKLGWNERQPESP